jgi:SAM-dependent methyltransferase
VTGPDPWRPWETAPAFGSRADQAFHDAAAVIRYVMKTEHAAFEQGDPKSPTLPWMPFQPADFLAILFECAPELNARSFLDVGCGPGTKMALARHFYGLEVSGIEIDPQMASQARKHGSVVTGDALSVPPGFYSGWDLIWLYRPFRDSTLERQLEERIMREMKPGQILAGASWETDLAGKWLPVVDDALTDSFGQHVSVRGAWKKPHPRPTIQV